MDNNHNIDITQLSDLDLASALDQVIQNIRHHQDAIINSQELLARENMNQTIISRELSSRRLAAETAASPTPDTTDVSGAAEIPPVPIDVTPEASDGNTDI